MHNYQDLVQVFNALFQEAEQTVLVKGEAEPLYLPSSPESPYAQVIFAHGFYQSALHEIAHWCLAGKQRRELIDYGYWYQPDGRSAEQQKIFESVEIKPQAMEWIFSIAAGSRFYVSADNLSGEMTQPEHFKLAVYQQAEHYLEYGLPVRAEQFLQALLKHYGKKSVKISELVVEEI
ncbi:MAG: elongation factor hydroxylase [Gammaproteobacteria bacterium]|jgi:elongation factor P hydroxylase|nr:elongation factor hydroxylase [Gammaproteobacteria bacterium]